MTKEKEEKIEKAEKKEEIKETEEKEVEKAISEDELLKAIEELEEFTKAKKEIEEEEEESEEEEEKSFAVDDSQEVLEKAIEISPFLEALVNETSKSLEAVGGEIKELKKSQSNMDGKYIETLKGLTEVVKGLHTELKEFRKSTEERLEVIEKTPITQSKSIKKAVEIKKSFAGEGGEEGDISTLPKSVIADALSKAVIDGKMKDTVLMAYEAEHNFPLTAEQQEIVKAYIK